MVPIRWKARAASSKNQIIYIALAQKLHRHKAMHKMINNVLFAYASSAKLSTLDLCHILNTLTQEEDCFMQYSSQTFPSNLASKNATRLPRTCDATVATVPGTVRGGTNSIFIYWDLFSNFWIPYSHLT
jgi:hypothetical protein